MKWIVYCTTCLINGKIYIGVHDTENPEVFDGYLGCGVEISHLLKNPKTAFQYAVKKYGFKNFKRSLLYVFDDADSAYAKEAEIVTSEFVKHKDNYNSIPRNLYTLPIEDTIYEYYLDGTFKSECKNVKKHAETIGCNPGWLLQACEFYTNYRSSYWSYNKVDKLDLSEYSFDNSYMIYQFSLNGEFINKWDSVEEICDALHLSKADINSAISKENNLGDFYFLKDENKIFDVLKSKEVYNCLPKVKIKEPRKIAQYDLDGNLIKVFNTLTECKTLYPKCIDCAKGIRKQTKGYTFKYIS